MVGGACCGWLGVVRVVMAGWRSCGWRVVVVVVWVGVVGGVLVVPAVKVVMGLRVGWEGKFGWLVGAEVSVGMRVVRWSSLTVPHQVGGRQGLVVGVWWAVVLAEVQVGRRDGRARAGRGRGSMVAIGARRSVQTVAVGH